jgi:hypothetical protein
MERRTDIDPKLSLAVWLRAGRAQKGMTLESVAKVTKIQARTLERLEAGQLDGLPAEVFVRGFIRSFAKCVGLDEQEALQRYAAATGGVAMPATSTATTSTIAARAFVETMGGLAPAASARAGKELAASSAEMLRAEVERAEVVVEQAAPVEAAPVEAAPGETAAPEKASGGRKKKRRGGKRAKRSTLAHGTPSSALPVVTQVAAEASTTDAPVEAPTASEPSVEPQGDDVVGAPLLAVPADLPVEAIDEEPVVMAEPWTPKMPTVVAPSVPWRRPHTSLFAAKGSAKVPVVPSLVIDDADPDSADREREERDERVKEPGRRSFLPPILLDREDRTARQGGLTLAVIILLIAATLTLSYLMRRPSSSGDGVTLDESGARTTLVG